MASSAAQAVIKDWKRKSFELSIKTRDPIFSLLATAFDAVEHAAFPICDEEQIGLLNDVLEGQIRLVSMTEDRELYLLRPIILKVVKCIHQSLTKKNYSGVSIRLDKFKHELHDLSKEGLERVSTLSDLSVGLIESFHLMMEMRRGNSNEEEAQNTNDLSDLMFESEEFDSAVVDQFSNLSMGDSSFEEEEEKISEKNLCVSMGDDSVEKDENCNGYSTINPKMPNLIYYKDSAGVLSRPLKEAQATALLKGNFFRPEHVFRIEDDEDSDDFCGMDDLKALNGDETPFKKPCVKDQKEIVRVYKELASLLKEKKEEQKKGDEKNKQNLVYYKDSDGVVSGPFNEEEATALYKGNFFGPDHLFRIVDAEESENFFSMDDLLVLNGSECPFKKPSPNDKKELVRMYKELATLLIKKKETKLKIAVKERNLELLVFFEMMKKPELFRMVRCGGEHEFTAIYNYGNISVRASYGNVWDPLSAQILWPGRIVNIAGFQGGRYVFIAPHLSDDPLDGAEHVITFYYPTSYKQVVDFRFRHPY